MIDITDSKIKSLLKTIEEFKKKDESYPWKFPNLEIETDEDKPYVYVPECEYLGYTNICLTNNSTGEEGEDCLLVQTAIEYFEPLLKEVQNLRTQKDKELFKDY